MGTEKRGRGRPRREGADEEILAVAREMLRESGDRVLTVDAVAERAGVAKTTVYRRWPTKSALVAAAITPLIAARKDEVDAVLDELRDAVRTAVEPRRERLIEILGDALLAEILIELALPFAVDR